MAKMYPDHPLGGTRSNAERKVFYALKELLPDDYTVLHHVPVYRRSERLGPLFDGEIDFLVIHPEKGVLSIEVKGGGIERDAETGKWSTISFDGQKNEIKDPYDQVKGHTHNLFKDVKKHESLRRFSYSFGHAVWFPDVDLSRSDLGISTELKNITLDREGLPHAANAIPRLFKNSIGVTPQHPPTLEGAKALRKFLAPSWEIRVSLSQFINEQREVIFEATQSQYKILSLFERFQHATICGSAGSGKTFLAVEKARRIVEQQPSSRVLLTCYNTRLAEHLREIVKDFAGIDVFHFHGLCKEFFSRARVLAPSRDPMTSENDFFERVLPEALLDVLDLVDIRYDAIIADEGQDFHSTWWLPLQAMLADSDKEIFYIFYDDNQILYDRANSFPIKVEPFILSENCRNTKAIHAECMKYYQGANQAYPLGPEGRVPEIVELNSSDDEKQEVIRIINRYISVEGVSPCDIVILTPRRQDTVWVYEEEFEGFTLTWDWSKKGKDKYVLCSTIHSFKGLESPVIILIQTKHIWDESREQMLYVATSRANSHLVVLNTRE